MILFLMFKMMFKQFCMPPGKNHKYYVFLKVSQMVKLNELLHISLFRMCLACAMIFFKIYLHFSKWPTKFLLNMPSFHTGDFAVIKIKFARSVLFEITYFGLLTWEKIFFNVYSLLVTSLNLGLKS